MAFTALKCTSCGANLEITDDREIGFCPYCGAKYVREEVNNVTNVTEINTVNYSAKSSVEDYVERIKALIKVGEFEKARKIIDEFKDGYSQKGAPYLYSALFCTKCKLVGKEYKTLNIVAEENAILKDSELVKEIREKINLEDEETNDVDNLLPALYDLKIKERSYTNGAHNYNKELSKANQLFTDEEKELYANDIKEVAENIDRLSKVVENTDALINERQSLIDVLVSVKERINATKSEEKRLAKEKQAEEERKAKEEEKKQAKKAKTIKTISWLIYIAIFYATYYLLPKVPESVMPQDTLKTVWAGVMFGIGIVIAVIDLIKKKKKK